MDVIGVGGATGGVPDPGAPASRPRPRRPRRAAAPAGAADGIAKFVARHVGLGSCRAATAAKPDLVAVGQLVLGAGVDGKCRRSRARRRVAVVAARSRSSSRSRAHGPPQPRRDRGAVEGAAPARAAGVRGRLPRANVFEQGAAGQRTRSAELLATMRAPKLSALPPSLDLPSRVPAWPFCAQPLTRARCRRSST